MGAVVLLDPAHGGATWTFLSGSWTLLSAVTPNVAAGSASVAFDWGVSCVVLVGRPMGSGGDPSAPGAYSAWKFSSGTWTNFSTSPTLPVGGAMGALVWDEYAHRLLLLLTSPSTVVWSLLGTSWTNNSTSTTRGPPARFGASVQYDPWGEFILVWGGSPTPGTLFPDVWGWDAPILSRPGNSTPVAASIPPLLEGMAVGIVAVPLAILAILYLRPRRPSPTRSSVPSPAPA